MGGIITEAEISDIVKLLKRRKAGGHDRIQHEHLLHGGKYVIKVITKLFNHVVKKGRIPVD